MRGAVPGDSGGRNVKEDDQKTKPSPRRNSKRKLANTEGYTASHTARHNPPERASPGVEGPYADRQTDEKGQREDSEGEQQPAEKADTEDDEQWSKDDHEGGLREIKV